MSTLQERLRDAGDDYTVEWGSGDLYYEAAARLDALEAALERTRDRLSRAWSQTPVRDAAETLAEADAAIDAARSKT